MQPSVEYQVALTEPCLENIAGRSERTRGRDEPVEDGPVHPEDSVLEVHVATLEHQKFALPHARRHRQYVEGFEPVSPGGCEQDLDLPFCEGLYFLGRDLGPLHGAGDVPGNLSHLTASC